MPSSPFVICLSDAERAELQSLSRRATAPHRMVLRARIVLLAADDVGNSEIARRLGTCTDTARKWRHRYCRNGLDGLADAPRAGRPRTFPATVVAGVKALACEMPAGADAPLELSRAGQEGCRQRHRSCALAVDGAPLARR